MAAIDCLHDLLGFAGMIPGIGGAFDAADSLIYAARGNAELAALDDGGVVPNEKSRSAVRGVGRGQALIHFGIAIRKIATIEAMGYTEVEDEFVVR